EQACQTAAASPRQAARPKRDELRQAEYIDDISDFVKKKVELLSRYLSLSLWGACLSVFSSWPGLARPIHVNLIDATKILVM
ncbi:MAG: hypothetical protein WAN05_19465, partial [Roseiarcus sp.]